MEFNFLQIIGQYGVPAGISVYLVWWLTHGFDKTLLKIQASIDNQTKVLNHTLTRLINRQATKDDIRQLSKNTRRQKK